MVDLPAVPAVNGFTCLRDGCMYTGEWRTALVVAAAQGDITAARRVAHAVTTTASSEVATEAARLATALSGLYGSTGGWLQ
jgi:hypothetical protein